MSFQIGLGGALTARSWEGEEDLARENRQRPVKAEIKPAESGAGTNTEIVL